MGIKPSDLPGFGTVPGDFVETEGSKIIVPKGATKESPLEELETPDQLEERKNNPPEVMITEIDTTVEEEPEQEQEEEKEEGINLDNMHNLHPDWEPNLEFQIKMFTDLLNLNGTEHQRVRSRMDAIEIFLEKYPLMASQDELQLMRKLIKRNYELSGERQVLVNNLLVRQEELAKINAPEPEETVDTEPESDVPLKQSKERGFFKKLFSRD